MLLAYAAVGQGAILGPMNAAPELTTSELFHKGETF
jgi:hypothetical protein